VATAAGIHRIVNARMNDEVRRVTVQRGYDPRQFSLLPLGGAGPVHGCAIALALGMASVIVPDTPGVLSAFGLLAANVEHDQMVTFAHRADRVEAAAFERAFAKLTTLGQSKMAADSVALACVEVRRQADMRYVGQSYELTIDIPEAADQIAATVARFHRRHSDFYGHSNASAAVEFVNLRTVHVHRSSERKTETLALSRATVAAPVTHRQAYFDDRGFTQTPIYHRHALVSGQGIEGPAIIEQPDTTLVIHPAQRATVRRDRSLQIEVAHG
jgi:N-methylhydantoinase A